MSHALTTVLHRGRRPRVTSWRRAWHPHGKGAGKRAACGGRAVSDDFGIMGVCGERMARAQRSSEGALTGNVAPENRDIQAGTFSPETGTETGTDTGKDQIHWLREVTQWIGLWNFCSK